MSCLDLPSDMPKTRTNVSKFVGNILTEHGLDESNIYFVTDEGSNVVHLGAGSGQRLSCFAHILATLCRHITNPYAGSQLPNDVKEKVLFVGEIITEMQQFVGELRFWMIYLWVKVFS